MKATVISLTIPLFSDEAELFIIFLPFFCKDCQALSPIF